jgi:RNA polymerase sigma factor (TIGR02999 family)
MENVTQILSKIEAGEASNEDLLLAVYEELRQLAQRKMARERRGHTLQATALVHEAWLRLGGADQLQWQNRRHFFGAAAEAMRRILVDHARARQTERRGGGHPPADPVGASLQVEATPDELLVVHEALAKLEEANPEAAELVKLRYFIGMTMQEAADALGLKKRSAAGLWESGRAWLRREIRQSS